MLKIQTEEIIDSVKYLFLLYTGTKTLIWVQDAGSSNLPTRTKSQNLHCRFWLFLCLWCSLFFAACVSRLPMAPQSSMFCYISQAYIRAKNHCSVIHSFILKNADTNNRCLHFCSYGGSYFTVLLFFSSARSKATPRPLTSIKPLQTTILKSSSVLGLLRSAILVLILLKITLTVTSASGIVK